MKTETIMEVIDCLPKGKTHFRYFKNGYAPKLLSMALREETSVRAIKHSNFGKFLENTVLKNSPAISGNGLVDPSVLKLIWQEPSVAYLLTASSWRYQSRGWSQVSRTGDNLVLQLNLPKTHQRLYDKHIGDSYWFNPCWEHPVQKNKGQQSFSETLAWARIDLSFETNEALIEEVQSDAVREMTDLANRVVKCKCTVCKRSVGYLQWFSSYQAIWSEAMLMAAIEFIFTELGIKQIFTHTARSGWRVKKMPKNWCPPKSLYADLPKKFGFRRVWNAPAFLLKTRSYNQLVRKQPDIDFYMLDLTKPIVDISKHKGECHG